MPTLTSAINASASGLDAQRARMEVAISNLTNAESTHGGPDGLPYRRREVVLATQSFESSFDPSANAVAGVKVQAVLEDQGAFTQRYDPSNPAAVDGYVSVPNVEVAEEMVDMVSAARAYQANLTAIGLIRDTIARALELAK
jgi:flagellar basal-body rod protein FlgC